MIHFGKKLNEIRQYYGYSQAQIAEKTGTVQTNISYWEGLEYPPLEEIIKILKIYDMTLGDMLECADLSPQEGELLRMFRNYTDRQREIIIDLFKEIK